MSVLFRVELYVKDIEESIKFYQDIIGLELYGRNERSARFNYDCFSLLITSETVLDDNHFFKNKAKSKVKGNGFEFIIVVDELETVHHRCLENNHPIEIGVEKYPWDMRGFKIADPDGYFLRITSK
ncbi:VOC family protein [Evansella cellulosilytica]|uniref:Glyoxalase/bleomycin resistance protein/dioxygenase n=1 Tax=Evansella cellulosilytica (strain ATCC 21833 / DSM 2522 / FERM P-1141 / JCM 9156 / N-4) TaxID=649639 RepID=E6TY62_EVAC2|nr:VOC family protein [Evansella cellulosilytica]ADU32381.1 Glyoxalase/bleomycin resistance protein/dioxygenase [Evansella cellulosilytica DSM 2522]